jgi:integrase
MAIESPYRITERIVKDARYDGGVYRLWMVSGTGRNGRHRRSFRDHDEAKEHKRILDLNHWNEGAAFRVVQTDLTDAQLTEARHCFSRLGDRNLSKAVDYFLEHHGNGQSESLSEAVKAYLADCEGRCRPRTLIQKKDDLERFEEFVNASVIDASVRDISTELVLRYLQSMRARNGVDAARPKTWNNRRVELLSFFGWCQSKPRQWIAANPVADVTPRLIEVEEINTIGLEQARELMEHVQNVDDGKLAPYFAIALFAGVRPAEITKLAQAPHLIDVAARVIRITPAISKTRRARQVKIRKNLAAWLDRFTGPIVPVNFWNDMRAVRKQFGLSHDVLRHTFISALVTAEGSFAEAAIESGNSEKIIRDHNFNAMPKANATAFWGIQPKT